MGASACDALRCAGPDAPPRRCAPSWRRSPGTPGRARAQTPRLPPCSPRAGAARPEMTQMRLSSSHARTQPPVPRQLAASAPQTTHRQVAFVANEHDGHVRVCVLARVLQPRRQVVERLAPGSRPEACVSAAGSGARRRGTGGSAAKRETHSASAQRGRRNTRLVMSYTSSAPAAPR